MSETVYVKCETSSVRVGKKTHAKGVVFEAEYDRVKPDIDSGLLVLVQCDEDPVNFVDADNTKTDTGNDDVKASTEADPDKSTLVKTGTAKSTKTGQK